MNTSKLLSILIAVYLARFIMPILSVFLPAWITIILSASIFFLLIQYKSVQVSISKLIFIYLLGFFLYLVPRLSSWGVSILPLYEYINALVLPSIIAYYLMDSRDVEMIVLIKNVVFLSLFITCITTYWGNQLMPGASRMMATGMAENPALLQTYYSYNIGGFDFIYTIVLLVPYIVYRLKTTTGGIRFFQIVFLISIFATVVATSYTIALLCTFFGLMTLFMPTGLKERGVIVYLVLAFVLVLLLRSYLPPILDGLSGVLNNEDISMRLDDLSQVIAGNEIEEESDIGSRQELYVNEWNSFLSSPLIGTYKVIGGHSFILGILSFYGLIGALMAFFFLKLMYARFFEKFAHKKIIGNLFYIFVVYVILLVLNPRCYFIVPSLYVPLLALEDRYKKRLFRPLKERLPFCIEQE